MTQLSNSEPRRFWRGHAWGERARCAACGARATLHSLDLPFCAACLDWARQSNVLEDDDDGDDDSSRSPRIGRGQPSR